MFGKEFDGAAVGNGIRLRKIFHGLHQQALAVHVARIGGALTAFASNLGGDRNGENLGHAIQASSADFGKLFSSIPPRCGFFSLYLHSFLLHPLEAAFKFFRAFPYPLVFPYPWVEINLVLLVVFSLKTASEIFSFTLISEYLASR